MSSESDKPLNGTPEPFRRPMVWGRPPATVFRAGPLPKGGRLPPLPEPPRASQPARPAAGIFSGSMIPRAAPRPAPEPIASTPPLPEPAAPAPVASAPVEEAHVTVMPAPAPDLTVRPLPPVQPVAAPLRAEPPLTQAPIAPSPIAVEPPAVGSTLRAASARGKASGRTVLYGGVAAAVIAAVAVGGWLMTRAPTTAPVPAAMDAPASMAAIEAPATVPAVVPTPAEMEEPTPVATAPEPAPVRTRAVTPAVARPTPSRPVAATAARTTPPPRTTAAPPPVITTAPLIEIAPTQPAGPPPTEAERPPADPDAPIATRPQPVG